MTPKFGFWLIVIMSALNILKVIEMAKFQPFEVEAQLMSRGQATIGVILWSAALIFGLYGLWKFYKAEKQQ